MLCAYLHVQPIQVVCPVLPGYPLSPSLFNDLPSALKVTGVSPDGRVGLACRSETSRIDRIRLSSATLSFALVFVFIALYSSPSVNTTVQFACPSVEPVVLCLMWDAAASTWSADYCDVTDAPSDSDLLDAATEAQVGPKPCNRGC